MKRKLLGLFLIIGMIFTLAACSDGKNIEGENPSTKESDKIYYSNLVDQEARMELEASLEAVGLSSTKVVSFLEQVDYFNQSIDGYGLVEEAFKDELKIEPDYDPYHMQDLWDESNPNFFGYNCRITSYFLMQDLIDVEKSEEDQANILVFDLDSIERGPFNLFNEEDIGLFKTLYYEIPTVDSMEVEAHVQVVQEYWKNKGLSFKDSDISHIALFFHEEEGFVFIGHVGILLPDSEGSLLFVEKVAFQEPYQLIRFKDRAELSDYLMEKYDLSWGQEVASPFIMENDQLMNIEGVENDG